MKEKQITSSNAKQVAIKLTCRVDNLKIAFKLTYLVDILETEEILH